MKKEQIKLFVIAWEKQQKILVEFAELADMNPVIAFGCAKTAKILAERAFLKRQHGL